MKLLSEWSSNILEDHKNEDVNVTEALDSDESADVELAENNMVEQVAAWAYLLYDVAVFEARSHFSITWVIHGIRAIYMCVPFAKE